MGHLKKSSIVAVVYFLFLAVSFTYYYFGANANYEKLQAAEEKLDPALCGQLAGEYWQNECYFNLAYKAHNRHVCDKISRADARTECNTDLFWGYQKSGKIGFVSRNAVILFTAVAAFFLPAGLWRLFQKIERFKAAAGFKRAVFVNILTLFIAGFILAAASWLIPMRDADLDYMLGSFLWFMLPSFLLGVVYSASKARKSGRSATVKN